MNLRYQTATPEILYTLQAVRCLISDPHAWTTNAWARDACDASVEPNALRACCWCIVGAMIAVKPDGCRPSRLYLGQFLSRRRHVHSELDFNDGSTHRHVLLALDTCIAECVQELETMEVDHASYV